MRMMVILFTVLFLVSCSGDAEPVVVPEVQPEFSTATATISEVESVPETAVSTTTSNPLIAEPSATPKPEPSLPDMSAVTLFEAAHLMDPDNFQVILENWPDDLPEGVQVQVDGEVYNCDELYPDQYPGRVYCWGPAPARGSEVDMIVQIVGVEEPLLEIRFTVPSPGGG